MSELLYTATTERERVHTALMIWMLEFGYDWVWDMEHPVYVVYLTLKRHSLLQHSIRNRQVNSSRLHKGRTLAWLRKNGYA